MARSAARVVATSPEIGLSLEGLGDMETRRRMSGPAVSLFIRTCDLWDLKVEERMAILGGISRQTYHNWKAGRVSTLSRDQLERISLVLGVLKGLRLVFAEDATGVRWMKAANDDAPFGGQAPLEVMAEGGIGGLQGVRRYLDAWRGVK